MVRRTAFLAGWLLLAHASMAWAQVQEAWVARYHGPGNSDDLPNAVAVDQAGNVYVTGGSVGAGTGPFDYSTAKYDAAGNELWVARYNGPGNAWDFARAVAVDAAGNVYVTGESAGADFGFDYATAKYDAEGNELWVARYTSPGTESDSARALAIDAAGHVYVTGQSAGHYATVKYDAQGNELWVARYSGAGNAGDDARAIAVDSAGHVYVTGSSYAVAGTDNFDYATVKYDADGNELWVARYDSPGESHDDARALAIDVAGNVYVTGRTGGADYGTVKYDAQGNERWVALYNGPGNSVDAARALLVDGAGNVYVTGQSIGAGTSYDYATIKYDADGIERWAARYNGPGNSGDQPWDQAFALAIDVAANVYVTGMSIGEGSGLDYATVKYDAEGNERWVARYNGPGNTTSDAALAVVVDEGGNVYVTGQSYGAGTRYDYATIKYLQTEPSEPQFTLTVNKAGIGNGTVISSPSGVDCGTDCDQLYVNGTAVTLTAKPAFGSIFIGWDRCDIASGMTCTVAMNAERSVTANFLGVRLLR